jgi:hypothetical protein
MNNLGIIIFLAFVAGCSEKKQQGVPFNDKEVISISLNVNPEWNYDNRSFKTKKFTDANSITFFIEAIENAEEMEGMLNYVAEFDMTVNFKDKSSEQYHLGLGVETEDEGLLVATPNTTQGYIIQKVDAKKLRGIIYK